MTSYVELNGIRFAYTESGTGPLAIHAHGLSSSRASEARFGIGDFSAVAEHGRLVSYDARGHGESSGSRESVDYTWSSLADDMLALMDYFSPDEPASLIGLSMGTGTALHAVVRAPERFNRLVLTAPPTAWETRAGQTAMYEQMADLAESNPPDVLATMFAQAPPPPIFAEVEGFPSPPDIAHDLVPTVFRGAGMSDLPPAELLSGIRTPTLIIAWATDPGHPVSTSEKLHALIPGSELHISESFEDLGTWGERTAAFLDR